MDDKACLGHSHWQGQEAISDRLLRAATRQDTGSSFSGLGLNQRCESFDNGKTASRWLGWCKGGLDRRVVRWFRLSMAQVKTSAVPMIR